jgi:hypothetical protein
MSHTDHTSDADHIDLVRRTHLERSTSRPNSKQRKSAPEDKKVSRRASGRLRTAAWRCSLDAKRRPESDVVGLALLSAVATWPTGTSFDPASIGIVSAAFNDLIQRGFDRHETEAVFKRFRKNLYIVPDHGSTNNSD